MYDDNGIMKFSHLFSLIHLTTATESNVDKSLGLVITPTTRGYSYVDDLYILNDTCKSAILVLIAGNDIHEAYVSPEYMYTEFILSLDGEVTSEG